MFQKLRAFFLIMFDNLLKLNKSKMKTKDQIEAQTCESTYYCYLLLTLKNLQIDFH